MPRFKILLVTIALVACGSDSPTQSDNDAATSTIDSGSPVDASVPQELAPAMQAGTRILLHTYDFEDQSVLRGLYDSEKATECRVVTASDGEERCLPKQFTGGKYLDSQCTEAVFTGYQTSPPNLVTKITQDNRIGVFPLLASIATPQNLFYQGPEGCVSAKADPVISVYPIGEEIPASDFVRFDVVEEVVDSELIRLSRAGEDGSRRAFALADRSRDNASCSMVRSGEELFCLPSARGFLYPERFFADDSCGVILGRMNRPPDGSPLPIVLWEPTVGNSCDNEDTPKVYELGAEYLGQTVYGNLGQNCTGSPVTPYSVFTERGPLIPASTFPALTMTRTGSEQLQAQAVAHRDGTALLPPGNFWDATLGGNCSYGNFTNGDIHCEPSGVVDGAFPEGAEDFFSDDGCTVPLYARYASCRDLGSLVISYNSSGTTAVYQIGALHPGAVYTNQSGQSDCELATDTQSRTMYTIGAQQPLSIFATIESSP